MNAAAIITGNICSILAMLADSVSSTRKTRKEMLLCQSLGQLCYCTGTIVLKGYSGAVQNAVSILRNLVAIRNMKNPFVEWFLVFLGVVLGLCFNNRGWMGLLPIIAHFQYSVAIFKCKDNERILKTSFAIAVFLYAVFNIVLLNIVGVCTNLTVMVTTLIVLYKNRKNPKEQ